MIEVDLHRVYFIRDNVDGVDIKSLKNDCLKSFKENNTIRIPIPKIF